MAPGRELFSPQSILASLRRDTVKCPFANNIFDESGRQPATTTAPQRLSRRHRAMLHSTRTEGLSHQLRSGGYIMPMSFTDTILVDHCITAAAAARAAGIADVEAQAWADTARAQDDLFGLWSAEARAFVFPDFQFQGAATAEKRRELFRVLRTRVGFDPVSEDRGGWARASWLYQPNPTMSPLALAMRHIDFFSDPVQAVKDLPNLSDLPRSPAELFGEEPDEVIAAARQLAAQMSKKHP